MPRMLLIDGGNRPVATEEELLAFANQVRLAGGATILEELLPAEPHNANRCLIANALNFGCSVDATGHYVGTSVQWAMSLPYGMTEAQLDALEGIEGCTLHRTVDNHGDYLLLPEHIGNAARSFDVGAAFQHLRNHV